MHWVSCSKCKRRIQVSLNLKGMRCTDKHCTGHYRKVHV